MARPTVTLCCEHADKFLRIERGKHTELLDKVETIKISCDVIWSTPINLHLPDVTLTSYTNGKIVTRPNRMSFEDMTELVKPVIGSDADFDKMVEELLNKGRTLIRPKDRPNSEIAIAMVQAS